MQSLVPKLPPDGMFVHLSFQEEQKLKALKVSARYYSQTFKSSY